MAALTAIAPNLGAGTLLSELLNDPIGVRTALAITTSYINEMQKACFKLTQHIHFLMTFVNIVP